MPFILGSGGNAVRAHQGTPGPAHTSGAGVAPAIGNVLWLLFAGWWLALIHIVAAIGFCLTIIGIRFGSPGPGSSGGVGGAGILGA